MHADRGTLERLIQDSPSYKGSGRLTLKMQKTSARAAIMLRSQESDVRTALAALKHDLQNGPRHCFGMHQHCSTDFCKTAREKQQQSIPSSLSCSMNTPEIRDEADPDNEDFDIGIIGKRNRKQKTK